MHHAGSSQGYSYTAPAAPHAFNLFTLAQSPHETHAMYDEFASLFKARDATEARASDSPAKAISRSRSAPSLKRVWRKWLGLEPSEPAFEFVTKEGNTCSSPSEDDAKPVDGSDVDELGVLHKTLYLSVVPKDEDDDACSSNGSTLVDAEDEASSVSCH